jgi:hypothetical protein
LKDFYGDFYADELTLLAFSVESLIDLFFFKVVDGGIAIVFLPSSAAADKVPLSGCYPSIYTGSL